MLSDDTPANCAPRGLYHELKNLGEWTSYLLRIGRVSVATCRFVQVRLGRSQVARWPQAARRQGDLRQQGKSDVHMSVLFKEVDR